jgi:hypothetical protein
MMTSEVSYRRWRQFSSTAAIAIAGGAVVALLLLISDGALSAQDKYSVRVPGGLAFSEFRGFEDWTTVAVSQSGELIEVILANPVMIKAYRAGAPGNGKPFPDGSKMAKIHWNAKKSAEAPSPTTVPDTLHDLDFRRAATGDTPSSTMTPRPTRSSQTGPVPTADSRATRSWRRRTTFSPLMGRGESC